MILAAIICMTVAFALLLAMLFFMAKEDAGTGALVGFGMYGAWMGVILYWLTHFGG